MPKFRKKPVVIEAMQFLNPLTGVNIAAWCGGRYVEDAMGPCILIDTLEGQMRADPEDWVIKGVKGEFYPCKEDIFAATYEPAEGIKFLPIGSTIALTPPAHEAAAAALAVACNGGDWDRDYAPSHKDLWRRRLDAALAVKV